jgi:hypothetical protein
MKTLHKRAIQIVKKANTSRQEPLAQPAGRHSVASAVAGWIEEHDATRRNELVFSNKNILKWQTVPDKGSDD